ncbi:hypothetical protein EYF80_052557 [Liparis tanakae]|uniref:Uncharacterized protein n=1 Tax=Liparis tanakae TaxID=230148 RepID=A0A4Z2F7R6_9TELE|nr:hypothetical protein EYF80_052557 [Liparis tanakae]
MVSLEYVREFVNERLTAAAEDIFGVFVKTIVEYQEEIDRQRRLLDIVWKPAIKLHRIEFPEQYVCKEENEDEVLCEQQPWFQERSSSLDQEDPEPPQIKEEQEELCTSQEEEQLELKQETETFMLTPTCEDTNHSEDGTLMLCTDETQMVVQETPLGYISIESAAVPEPNKDHDAQNQDQKGGKHGDSESTENAEPKLMKVHDTKSNTDCQLLSHNCHSESEAASDHQFLSYISHGANSHDQTGSTMNAELKNNLNFCIIYN